MSTFIAPSCAPQSHLVLSLPITLIFLRFAFSFCAVPRWFSRENQSFSHFDISFLFFLWLHGLCMGELTTPGRFCYISQPDSYF